MSDYFESVAQFHDKFSLPVSSESRSDGRTPQLLTEEEMDFRTAFLFEEINEMIQGYGEKDLAKVADAIVDAVYVLLGTAHCMGLPFDALWTEVQRANMAKRPWQEGDPLKPRNAVGLDVVKPEGWRPPDIAGVLKRFRPECLCESDGQGISFQCPIHGFV